MKPQTFLGGLPTDIDVRTIRDAFPEEELAGEIADKQVIADLIKCDVRSFRFRTVTHRWRSIVERETGKIIGLRNGVFHVLEDDQKVDLACGKQRSAMRSVRRSVRVIGLTDRRALTDEDQTRVDHAARVAASLMQAASLKTIDSKLTEIE